MNTALKWRFIYYSINLSDIKMEHRKILQEIEIMRAIAIILIILCHIHYFITITKYDTELFYFSFIFAQIGLSLFFFISGFINYYNNNKPQNILKFYYKRLKRIYPIYWIALIIIWLTSYLGYIILSTSPTNIIEYLTVFLGFQEFFYIDGHQNYFWFVSVIIMYYLLYPLIIKPKKLINKLSVASAIFILMFMVNSSFGLIERNFFKYYWIFIGGIVLCIIKYDATNIFSSKLKDYILLFFVFVGALYVSKYYYTLNYVFISFIPTLILYYVLYKLFNSNNINLIKLESSKIYKTFSAVSLASYPTYIFHIIILSLFLTLLKFNNFNQEYINILIFVIGIPLVFLVSYFICITEIKFWHVYPNLDVIRRKRQKRAK